MARFFIQALIITIFASVLELFLPWWSIAFAAFIGGYVFRSNANFLAGFLSIALLWAIASFIIDFSSNATLTERVATIFTITKPLLFVVTAVIGGLVGGFAAMAGSSLRNEKRKMKYY
jgi:hypothetical protein